MKHRPIHVIAAEIADNWPKCNYAAEPYLGAMHALDNINDTYGLDSARSIIWYFLANASTYRGELAKLHKAELKALIN